MNDVAQRIPRTVAIIMDGNGRWAREQGKRRVEGHRVGAESVRAITRECARLGVDSLTLYAFSLENFKRPAMEVSFLMRLLGRFLKQERREIMDNNIRFRVIGRREMLPSSVVKAIAELEQASADNQGMGLNLALAYGGRAELVDAARSIATAAVAGKLDPEAVDEELFATHLYQPGNTEVDLLIRTAGEVRVSNFMLWQISYAEIHVAEICWPEFREEALARAFADFNTRVRKFGGLMTEGADGS